MKFEVKNRYTGNVQFTADIDCDENATLSVKMGLAVKWGVKNKANLREADLRGANLWGADLREADLREADLRGANLWGADLWEADLREADLRGANLRGADLREADLREADLREADLWEADLREADLWEADLWGADLRGANLRGADLWEAKNIFVFGGVGNHRRLGFAVKHEKNIMIQLGCFWDTEKEVIAAVSEKYGAKSGYVAVIKAACKCLKEQA